MSDLLVDRFAKNASETNFKGLAEDEKKMLLNLQRDTFHYFLENTNPQNGLIADKNQDKAPASIAACGIGYTVYCVAAKRGWISREQALHRVLTGLRFFKHSAQNDHAKNTTGYKGFYYHFLDYQDGKRMWESEISTIDTALLLAGALTACAFFDGNSDEEKELRELVHELYCRVDWKWALNGRDTIVHGWTPEEGFTNYRWSKDYSEAMILYCLALGAPEGHISPAGYHEWASTFKLSKIYDWNYLHAGPLFIHQLSHMWIDFRGINDDFNRRVGFDYFKNSEYAARVQQRYAMVNPCGYRVYKEHAWGLTASDGPGPTKRVVDGVEREFFGYLARGVPDGPDDGTLSPWAVVTSLPFAPDIVVPSMKHAFKVLKLGQKRQDGLEASYNPTYVDEATGLGWASPWKFGINEGPVILMIENFCSEMIWDLTKNSAPIRLGLSRMGFKGGWLA